MVRKAPCGLQESRPGLQRSLPPVSDGPSGLEGTRLINVFTLAFGGGQSRARPQSTLKCCGPADTSLPFPRCSHDSCYLGAAGLEQLLCKVVTF